MTSLRPGSLLSHYRVTSFLGAGDMGEVYLARDETLGRNVALKVLPPTLMKEEQRVRRFVQEARSASSLNHPHIVTIYEILQANIDGEGHALEEGAPREGETSNPIQFIAMEFVAGGTLRDLIYKEKTDIRSLLRYLAQAADGLAKAHAAGIVHRDLKPDNIMVSEDGYAKILDFGLAKLIERETPLEGATSAPTRTEEITQQGIVVGTAAYMSPEQVQAKNVDHRSDIFSFGCILYEAVTRCRPFMADSSVEVMHRILHDNPTPVSEINPDVPAEVRRLIRRCLAKNPEQRFQSMKDLAIELNEIVEEFDQLPISSDSRSSVAASARLRVTPRSLAFRGGLAAVVILGIAGLGFGLWSLRERLRPGRAVTSFQSMSIARLLSVENLVDNALSPDGRYLATVTREASGWILRVRQVATGSDVQVLPPQEMRIGGIRFTPDGNYIYYVWRDPEKTSYRWLCRVPTLGGEPRRLIFDVDSTPTFSPDGRQVAFYRWDVTTITEGALMIANADGGGERRLAAWKFPSVELLDKPSWSPDGRMIAVVCWFPNRAPAFVEVTVADGRQSEPFGQPGIGFYEVEWLPDGSGLVGVGSGWSDPATQIWFLSPTGKARRITNDLGFYSGLSISSDSKSIAAAQTHRRANVWMVPAADPSSAHPIGRGPEEEGLSYIRTGSSGRVIFTTSGGGGHEIWSLDPTNGRRTRLTPEGLRAANLEVARETGLIVFTSLGEDEAFHIWRMDADGSNLSQVTTGGSEWLGAVSPDGQSLLCLDYAAQGVWKMSLTGAPPVKVSDRILQWYLFSRDGKFILHDEYAEVGGITRSQIEMVSADGGPPIRTYEMPDGSNFRWAPSGEAITYVCDVDGVQNIWKKSLDGGEPEQITRFESGRIFSYDWSADGSQIYLSRGKETTDVVLITGFR